MACWWINHTPSSPPSFCVANPCALLLGLEFFLARFMPTMTLGCSTSDYILTGRIRRMATCYMHTTGGEYEIENGVSMHTYTCGRLSSSLKKFVFSRVGGMYVTIAQYIVVHTQGVKTLTFHHRQPSNLSRISLQWLMHSRKVSRVSASVHRSSFTNITPSPPRQEK